MTDRHSAYLVVLDHDLREDDAEAILSALRQIRGVLDVQPVLADGIGATIAHAREHSRWRQKVLALLEEDARDQ